MENKLTKEERADKLSEWLSMDYEEKRKYNGYAGFLKGELFKESNRFMIEDKERLKRRTNIEKERRDKIKNGI